MTFVPPDEAALNDPAVSTPPEPTPGNVVPQNDHPGFTDAEWAEIAANLDNHYRELYGSDDGTGSQPSQAGGQPPAPAAAPSASATPVASPPVSPAEYELGAVRVPAEDAASLAALYTMIRNDPDRGAQILAIIEGRTPSAPMAPAPTPVWQQQLVATPQAVPTPVWQQQPVATPQPVQPSVSIVPPEVIETMDPATRFMYDRLNAVQQQQEQLLAMQRQQQEAVAQQQRLEVQRQRIARDSANGIARFRRQHPEISDDQFATINQHAQQLGILGGLLQQLPGDQAVARSFELARLDLGSSLTGAPQADSLPADARRQRTLTALAGGSAGSVSRQEPPTPVDTASDPNLSRAKAAAVEMLKQQGINLADHL
jgi:hypothetical protein